MALPNPDQAPATLPAWAAAQAARRGQAVALRHKKRGIWHALDWAGVHDAVARLAAALAARGLTAGGTLVLLTQPRPEALLLSLAAQTLGATAVPLDPQLPVAELARLLAHLQPAFVFAEAQEQVALVLVLPLAGSLRLLVYADPRGLAGTSHPALAAYETLLAAPPLQAFSTPQHPAFRFYRIDAEGELQSQQLSHRELLKEGARLVKEESLSEHDEALAARAFAAGSQARYLLAPWLIAGFVLNFPENLATRDHDRRELGPTLVLGTRETYARVAALAQERLPAAGSLLRRGIDGALAPNAGLLARVLGWWLVRRPLRDVLGFSRARTPLLVGAPLDGASAEFFNALGIRVHAWPDAPEWSPQRAPRAAPAGTAHPPQGLTPALR